MKDTQSQDTKEQGTKDQDTQSQDTKEQDTKEQVTKRKPYNPPRTRRHQGHVGRLARLYYPPKMSYKRAIHLFRQEIRLTRGLLEALQAVGYRENQRILTPRQVQVIMDFLGEP